MTNINYQWPADILLDMLTDAFEGGMSGWAQVESYHWRRWYVDGDMINGGVRPDLGNNEVLLRVREDVHEPGANANENPQWVDVTLTKLRKAANLAVANYAHTFGWIERDGFHITDVDYDAVSADIVLQYVVLGEVVYG